MKHLIILIALSSAIFASQKGYCQSLNERFDRNLEAAEVAHEFEDMSIAHSQFDKSKKLFYEAIVGNCKKYIDMSEMKENLRKSYTKYTKEKKCIK